MNIRTTGFVAAAIVIAVLWKVTSNNISQQEHVGSDSLDSISPGAEDLRIESSRAAKFAVPATAPIAVAYEPLLIQTAWPLGQQLEVVTRERDSEQSLWDESESTYSWSEYIMAFDGRKAGEFYVASERATGETVIEKWVQQNEPGAVVQPYQGAQVSLGTPVPLAQVAPTAIRGGGVYVPPANRGAVRLARSVIYSGNEIGTVQALQADPDGRFLLVLDRDSILWSIDLNGSAPLAVILDSASAPGLETAELIRVQDHELLGRCYVLHPLGLGGNPTVVLLPDEQNDGLFESALEMDWTTYEQTGFTGPVWTEKYW